LNPIPQLSPAEVASWLADPNRVAPFLLDVREAWEVQTCQIPGSTHVVMGHVPAQLDALPDDRDIVVVCHHGFRSQRVALFLNQNGISRVFNLAGGIAAWAREVDPGMATY
jgi:rhodanese-related sulfurtransferase